MTNSFTCPNCDFRLTVPDDAVGALTCPRCGAEVLPPDPDRELPSVRPSVRVWSVLLAVAGGLAIALTLLAGVAAASDSNFTTLALIVAGLFVILLVGTISAFIGKGERKPLQLVARALYRSLVVAGILFLLLFTVCIAFGVYFLVACFNGGLR